jgi:hypothetical protein
MRVSLSYDALEMINSQPANLLPPPNTFFGHTLRGLWSLDHGIHFLNHASFGAAPCFVLEAQLRWRASRADW